jgi:hypothetical protein
VSEPEQQETSRHSSHCFVVMPSGKTSDEHKWFMGWYEVVIKPAVEASGYACILAAAEEQPGAINDEIRAHLAFDPMVIVDLAGFTVSDAPNPNVMYELGIRHAFGLPLVVMAWEHQTLPFDVSNQRAIMCQRGFKDIEPVKQKLVQFINAAKSGNYYRPMEAVGRNAALDTTSLALGKDSALAALIDEVRDLRTSIASVRHERASTTFKTRVPTIKNAVGNQKSGIWLIAKDLGYDASAWSKVLALKIDEVQLNSSRTWNAVEWTDFLRKNKPATWSTSRMVDTELLGEPSEFVQLVDEMLGPQPWPTGEARSVAEKLGVGVSQVSKAVRFLIASGKRKNQENGQVFETEEEYKDFLITKL